VLLKMRAPKLLARSTRRDPIHFAKVFLHSSSVPASGNSGVWKEGRQHPRGSREFLCYNSQQFMPLPVSGGETLGRKPLGYSQHQTQKQAGCGEFLQGRVLNTHECL